MIRYLPRSSNLCCSANKRFVLCRRLRGSLTWSPATVVSIEHSTKLNKFNYTLKWLHASSGDESGDLAQSTATNVAAAAGVGDTNPAGKDNCDAPGADTENTTTPTSAETATEGAPDRVSELLLPGTVFRGLYECSQGRTPFQVAIIEHRAEEESVSAGSPAESSDTESAPQIVHAEFTFTHEGDSNSTCTGSFGMIGELSISNTSRLELQPSGEFGSTADGWITNLCNYSSVALLGEIDPIAGSFTGDVHDSLNACSSFESFVQPAPVSFVATVIGDWWGTDHDDHNLTLEISGRGARMELDRASPSDHNATNTAAVTKEALQRVISAAIDTVYGDDDDDDDDATGNEEDSDGNATSVEHNDKLHGTTAGAALLDNLAAALDEMQNDEAEDVDEDDVLRLLIKLILADNPVLEFGLSEIKSWKVIYDDDWSAIRLKLTLEIGDADKVTQLLTFHVEDPRAVESALRKQVVYALNVQGKGDMSRDLLKPRQPRPVCPSAACDVRLKSSRIRRAPAVAFVSDEHMEDQTQWVGLRAAVVITETQMYFFEGYSHHFGAYWRFEGDADDNDGQPNYFHTEMALRRHAPLWLYTRLLCDTGPRGENRVKGSPTLNIHCSRSIAEAKLTALADTATLYGLPIAMNLRLHVFAVDVAVWAGHLMQVFTSHVILWVFLYVPSVYCVVNLLRHVDTPTATVNQVAAISVYTYAPLMVFTDLSAMLLRYGLVLKDSVEVSAVVSVETSLWFLTGVENVLKAFWCQLGLYLCWTAYVFMLLRAKDETTKCAAAAAARGRRMEQQANTSYEDDFSGEPTCRICLGDEADGRLISPCLCKGSMRFVHIECLTLWRTSSTNTMSFFACDSCQYR